MARRSAGSIVEHKGADGTLYRALRFSAYGMSPGDPASVCQGIAAWGGGVTVWTRDPGLRDDLAGACDPAYDYEVVVLGNRSG